METQARARFVIGKCEWCQTKRIQIRVSSAPLPFTSGHRLFHRPSPQKQIPGIRLKSAPPFVLCLHDMTDLRHACNILASYPKPTIKQNKLIKNQTD